MAQCFFLALLFVANLAAAGDIGKKPISDYFGLEKSVLSRVSNIDRLMDAFFPVNRQNTIVVDVYYYYCVNPKDHNTKCSNLELSAPNNAESWENVTEMYKFRWSISFVNTFIHPDLLNRMSLYTFYINPTKARVVIDRLSGDTSFSDDHGRKLVSKDMNDHSTSLYATPTRGNNGSENLDHVCRVPPAYLTLLNRFTANALKSMAMHRHSSHSIGMLSEDERGFSSFYFSPVDYPNDYCVLPNEIIKHSWFFIERTLLLSALICVAIFISLATPPALTQKSVYNYVHENARNVDSNWRYFIWALVLSLAPLNLLVILVQMSFDGIYTMCNDDCRSYYKDVTSYYYIRLVMFSLFPAVDLLITLVYCFVCEKDCLKGDFPLAKATIPTLGSRSWVSVGLQALGIVTIQISLKLLIFHAVYILLGFIASPIQVLSIGTLYAAGVFCVIVYSAVWLKFCSCTCDDSGTLTCLNGFFKNILLPFITGVLFLGFVALIIVFIYRTIVASEDYRNSGGVTTFITSLAPTALLGVIGYTGKRLISLQSTNGNGNNPVAPPDVQPAGHVVVDLGGGGNNQPLAVTQQPAVLAQPDVAGGDELITADAANAAAQRDHEERPLLGGSSSARSYGSADTT